MERTMLVLILVSIRLSSGQEFAEEALELKTLNNHQAYAVFNFSTSVSDLPFFTDHHYNLFPRSVGEIVQKYNVAEFHLTMTRGLWRYEHWGYPYFPGPPGAQLWVWFNHNTGSVDNDWYGFTNALSGLLCASLNFIGKTETVSPKLSFRPEGAIPDDSQHLLRHAVLPRENLCTENLTPWLKLLPCGSNSGISWLLNPARLHHSQYLSLGLHFKQVCNETTECEQPAVNLQQSVSTVFDLRISSMKKPDFSIGSLMQRKLKGACPISRKSQIRLRLPEGVKVHPRPSYNESDLVVYDLLLQRSLTDIEVIWDENPHLEKLKTPPLLVHCHLTGIGHQDGGVQCRLNNGADHNVSVIVMQTVPWFLQVYLHTLKINDENGGDIKKGHFTFYPARIRNSPHFMEYMITVPESSTVTIAIQFTRGFLTWTEHPPDANHGFYIGSTVVSVRNNDLGLANWDFDSPVQRIYTESIQVHIPVPDFSMPYNVICLACTVIAIAFGSLHNLTTRRFKKLDPDSQQNTLVKILSFLKQVGQRGKSE